MKIAMDGNLANAGVAEGATMDGGDRRGESCQSQMENTCLDDRYFLFNHKFWLKQKFNQVAMNNSVIICVMRRYIILDDDFCKEIFGEF